MDRDEQHPAEQGDPRLRQGDAEEGPPRAHAERAGALLQGRVDAAQHRRHRQVDERVVGEGDDPAAPAKPWTAGVIETQL